MSHDHVEKPTDITVPPTSLWARLPMIGAAMAVIGLGLTFAMAASEGSRARALFAFLWAFEFWLSIGLGCLGLVLIHHVARAGWSAVVLRIWETGMATLPVFFLLFIVIGTVGLKVLYPWTHETDESLERKRWFLTEGAWWTRAVIYFVAWTVLAYFLYSWSQKRDRSNDVKERETITRKMWIMAAPGVIFFALSLTFQAVDWEKSLAPHWFSTMWGVYYFAGAMFATYSFTALVALGLQRAGMLKNAITAEHYHDIGKLMFGFTVFWAYIGFSQFMLQWYANMPEETSFWMHRVHGGWEKVSYALPVIHFFVPFLMIVSRHVKRNRTGIAICAVYFLLNHLIDHYWIVMPNFTGAEHVENMVKSEAEHAANGAATEIVSQFAPSIVDLFAIVGVAGLFFLAFGFFLNRNKVIAIGEPRLEESLAHENY